MQNFDANFSEVIQLLIAAIHTGIKYKDGNDYENDYT